MIEVTQAITKIKGTEYQERLSNATKHGKKSKEKNHHHRL